MELTITVIIHSNIFNSIRENNKTDDVNKMTADQIEDHLIKKDWSSNSSVEIYKILTFKNEVTEDDIGQVLTAHGISIKPETLKFARGQTKGRSVRIILRPSEQQKLVLSIQKKRTDAARAANPIRVDRSVKAAAKPPRDVG
jgi:hypothetical protein